MLSIFPVSGLPIIAPGDRLVDLLADRLRPLGPRQGDVLVVTSKIVSKAEGRFVNLRTVTPGTEARTLAAKVDKDPRLVQVILDESAAVSRARGRVLIMRHRLGFICANAGVDHSNTSTDPDIVLLLPKDPDASARALRDGLARTLGVRMPIVLADSHGRPHRGGAIGAAIGLCGLPGVEDWRGREDLFGVALQHTEVGLGDMIATAATLVMGQAAEGTPAALVRGVIHDGRDGSAAEIIRPPERDLFS
ncbi:MAG: coenzyme F420-0:L-glutamate ligase [Thermoflexales bacterium]|nr:coenzyme F420-0:L-glutamate ligase [Thermoflexales bacterium]